MEIIDLQNEILTQVRSEISKEDLEAKGVFSTKMEIERKIVQRIWYTIIVKLLGSFSLNIQIKRNGKILFEYEIPKREMKNENE